MFTRVKLRGERHSFGGDGVVYFARFQDIAAQLIDSLGGCARCVYMDPPFGTGSAFQLRLGKAQVAYTDRLDDEEQFEMMRSAIELAYELLSQDGTLFLHIDYRLSAKMRFLCDEIFGERMFVNEIIWSYKSGGRSTRHFARKHDTILMYRKSAKAFFNIEAVGTPRGDKRRNNMKKRVDEDGRVYYSIRTRGKEYRYYEDDLIYPSDVWDDIEHLHQRDPERTGFVTQKPEALMRRIILSTTKEGDTVVDLFGGSGTTAATASQLKRRFVSVDMGKASLMVTRKRLIEQHSRSGMFADPKPFTVDYFGCSEDIEGDFCVSDHFIIKEEADGAALAVKGEEILYAAVGKIENGIFYAMDYLLHPKKGDRLIVSKGEALHMTDYDCKQTLFVSE